MYYGKNDKKRLLVEIYYEFDDDYQNVYENFGNYFSQILKSKKVWQYTKIEKTNDHKYTSGSQQRITREELSKISKSKNPLKFFRTNVAIPYIGLMKTELFFFPERLVIKRGKKFEAIMYHNLDCYCNITQFLESSGKGPRDSKIVSYSWRYQNLDGGPDKRFSDNYQIPRYEYSEYTFDSSSGLNEVISTSKVGCFDNFMNILKSIGNLHNRYR